MSAWATLDGAPPQVIAHRGASGVYPEHVLPGYQLALDQGADIIEPDLLPSRDGVLFCRHDLGLARSTDVAMRPEFAACAIAGDWPLAALRSEQIDTLRARQPFGQRGREHDGRYPPPRFADFLAWAGEQARGRGRAVAIYPELKHPQQLAEQGLDPVPLLLQALASRPPGVDVLLQCFDAPALQRLHRATGLPCALLVDSAGDPEAAAAEHGDWLSGLALSKKLLRSDGGRARIEALHARGLRVDAWTFRDDQVGPGFADIEAELEWAMRLGVDRLFCDYPATALRVRDALGLRLSAR